MKYKRLFFSLLIAVMVIGVAYPAAPAMAAGNYDYSRKVTIDADLVTDDFSDFPIVISETIADLATTANGGDIENTDATGGASGSLTVPADFDIGTNQNCTNDLSFEFEDYDAATGEIIVWVEIDVLDADTDTDIYLCYGDSAVTTSQEDISGTWSNNYVVVYHMDTAAYDSGAGGHDGTDYADWGDNPGQIGRALSFDGVEDYWAITDHADLDITGEITLEAWTFLAELTGDIKVVLSKGGPNGYDMLALPAWGLDTNMYFDSDDMRSIDSINDHSWSTSTWHYLAVTYSDTNDRYEWYHDGASDGSQTTTASLGTTAADLHIGSQPSNTDRNWKGRLDEIRISDVERSDEWLETAYNNMAAPSSFVTVSAEVNITPPEIIMGSGSLSGVPSALTDAVETALNTYRPDNYLGLDPADMANMWAITNYNETDTEDYYWVTLAGIVVDDTEDLDGWDPGTTIWSGMAIAEDNGDTTYTAHIDGSAGYTVMVDAAGLADVAHNDVGGSGSAYYYFPWAAGFKAYYGSKGVHGAGDSHGVMGGTGWQAIDWVGGTTGYASGIFPNGVYVSQSGVVSKVCRDDVQTWVQIGDFIYAHLIDNETLRTGVYHSQGSYLGALLTGTHLTPGTSYLGCPGGGSYCVDASCGYTYQQATSYHLHWGFKPSGNYFTVENWTLNVSTENWVKGSDNVGPGEYLEANWSSGVIVPTPGPTVTPGGPTVTPGAPILVDDGGGNGGQIWDGFLAGMKRTVQRRVDDLQAAAGTDSTYGTIDGNGRRYVQLAVSGFRIMIRSVYVLLHSNLNLSVTIALLLPMMVLESIRAIGSLWMWIKSKIPFIG